RQRYLLPSGVLGSGCMGSGIVRYVRTDEVLYHLRILVRLILLLDDASCRAARAEARKSDGSPAHRAARHRRRACDIALVRGYSSCLCAARSAALALLPANAGHDHGLGPVTARSLDVHSSRTG